MVRRKENIMNVSLKLQNIFNFCTICTKVLLLNLVFIFHDSEGHFLQVCDFLVSEQFWPSVLLVGIDIHNEYGLVYV